VVTLLVLHDPPLRSFLNWYCSEEARFFNTLISGGACHTCLLDSSTCTSNPRFSSVMAPYDMASISAFYEGRAISASYDVASNICQALISGLLPPILLTLWQGLLTIPVQLKPDSFDG